MEPFVALTTTLEPEGGGYRKPLVSLYANYVTALSRVGLNPVLVSPAHTSEQVAALIDASSGLVLTGGEDIDPRRYGEDPVPELGEVNVARDAMEWHALEVALDRDRPVFGICRGMQVLNVYFGGTLFQDLPSQRDEKVTHQQDAPWGQHQHNVRCANQTRLHHILGECVPLHINSFHHQAVKDLAPGIACTAEAEDGLIEGIEHTKYNWVVGVQWHPERHEAEAPNSDPNLRIISAFADEVRATAAALGRNGTGPSDGAAADG